jgi:adenylate cyclase
VERLEIPATVNSLLASRIDRLGERDKHALQAAAVIGKDFSRPILTPVAELPDMDLDEALSILKGGEFIYEQALYPVAEYSFKHPLTQEVALGSQLHERKRRLHARAAEALQTSLADKLDESAALIAYHWEEADENAQAARWHRRAAEWIVGSDPVQAVRHWQHVRSLGTELVDDKEVAGHVTRACRMILSLGGWRMGISADEVNEIADQGRALAERVGDVSSLAVILAAHGARHGMGGRADLFHEMALESLALINDDSLLEERIYSWTAVGYSSWCCGRTTEALAAFEQVESLTAGNPNAGFELSGFSGWTWSHHMKAWAFGHLGRVDEGEQTAKAAVAQARKYSQTENLGWALCLNALICLPAGSISDRSEDPREAAVEGLEIAVDVGSSYSAVVAYGALGHAHLLMGDYSKAVEAERTALELMDENRTALEMKTSALSTLSESLRQLGDYAGAVEAARKAVETAQQQPCIADGIRAQTVLGTALIALNENGGPDPRDEVKACLSRAAEWLEESGALGMEPRIRELEQRLASL